MKIFDITVKTEETMPVYQGDPKYQRVVVRNIDADGYRLSKLVLGSHTGTHVDAPSHFMRDGKCVCDAEIERFVGPCYVTTEPLYFPEGTERLLIKGKNGRITHDVARKIVNSGVKLVGTEMLSIGGDETHLVLLGADVFVLENLSLDVVPVGRYFLFAPPLKIDADGCPVRACLVEGIK